MATLAGAAGFGAAIGIHFVVGYLDAVHLAPAFLGAAVLAMGVLLETRASPALLAAQHEQPGPEVAAT